MMILNIGLVLEKETQIEIIDIFTSDTEIQSFT